MKNKTDLTLDTRDFDRTFPLITQTKIPNYAAEAMRQEIPLILADAIMIEPRAPHEWGNLWRTQKVGSIEMKWEEIGILFGFNADYAAAVHELGTPGTKHAGQTINWTMPGSGAKYLEDKLSKFGSKYYERIANKIEAKGNVRGK